MPFSSVPSLRNAITDEAVLRMDRQQSRLTRFRIMAAGLNVHLNDSIAWEAHGGDSPLFVWYLRIQPPAKGLQSFRAFRIARSLQVMKARIRSRDLVNLLGMLSASM
jgi:hypothetical protein